MKLFAYIKRYCFLNQITKAYSRVSVQFLCERLGMEKDELQKIVEKKGIDPANVLVTTLDADNRPHKSYFAGLTYVYAVCHRE